MNGGHDIGGTHGLGPIVPEMNEPVFHSSWERRCFALTLAVEDNGLWSIDTSRFACENRHPADYLTMSYHEIWLASLEALLVVHGVINATDLDDLPGASSTSFTNRMTPGPGVGNSGIAANLASTCDRQDRARFSVGDRVGVRRANPAGHTRVPGYVRGCRGIVEQSRGMFAFPDADASCGGDTRQHLYNVSFSATQLWGRGTRVQDTVALDVWDDHLEAL